MLYRPSCNVPSEVVQVLSGRELDRVVRASTPTKRALLAADIEAGRVAVERHTARQARLLARASSPYANAARKLSPTERAACRIGGLKLAEKARERCPLYFTGDPPMKPAAIVPDDDISITSGGNAESKPSTAFVDRHKIWLAGGTACPQCGRRLHATDVEAGFGDLRFVCSGCHADVLVVESAS